MIPMYFDFLRTGLFIGTVDGNWVLWLASEMAFSVGGLETAEREP